jgi:hypothetical protein
LITKQQRKPLLLIEAEMERTGGIAPSMRELADHGQASVEEQLAIKMAFLGNRSRLGEASLELLRLVCQL